MIERSPVVRISRGHEDIHTIDLAKAIREYGGFGFGAALELVEELLREGRIEIRVGEHRAVNDLLSAFAATGARAILDAP